jgi:endonuclease/exonuclease/phosphatase family metal-dependent hydrolase
MIITVMAQNTENGGLTDDNGDPQDRWPLLLERVRSVSPAVDVLLLTEAMNWDRFGHRQLARAVRDLDMDVLPSAPSNSGLATLVFSRRETMGRWSRWNTDLSTETLHGFGVAVFDVGLPQPLSLSAVHLTPYDANRAAQEANLIASRAYKYGPYAIVGGDINYGPSRGPDPLFDQMRPYNVGSRTRLADSRDGRLRPNRDVARTWEKNGYIDSALYLYEQTENEDLLQRTSHDDRIDQCWVSAPLAPALMSYERVEKPLEASDHSGIVIRLDTELVNTSNIWEYR